MAVNNGETIRQIMLEKLRRIEDIVEDLDELRASANLGFGDEAAVILGLRLINSYREECVKRIGGNHANTGD